MTAVIGRPPKRVSADERREMARRHLDGETVTRIAREMQFKPQRVRKILEEAGIEVRAGAWGRHHPRWNGGRTVDKKTGYVRVTLPRDDEMRCMADHGGQVFEHRYVMAVALGRPLRAWETVHHIDGNRSNNDLGNLQLRIGQHGQGARYVCNTCGSTDVEAVRL